LSFRKGAGLTQRVDAAEARKADQIERLINPTNNLPEPALQYAVSDGRDSVGTIEHRDGYFVAIDCDGNIVGRFHDLKVAVRALPDARRA
jgi:hypothetical protein